MEQTTFTYEAREQMLVIHLPGELDHHNCRTGYGPAFGGELHQSDCI